MFGFQFKTPSIMNIDKQWYLHFSPCLMRPHTKLFSSFLHFSFFSFPLSPFTFLLSRLLLPSPFMFPLLLLPQPPRPPPLCGHCFSLPNLPLRAFSTRSNWSCLQGRWSRKNHTDRRSPCLNSSPLACCS